MLAKIGRDNLRAVSVDDFERGDAALVEARSNRSRVEYFFTCTPSLPRYVLEQNPGIGGVAYLDADLFFYSDPGPVYDELGDGSVLIVGHRFPQHLRHFERYGVYNVGLLAFRNDRHTRECLDWWRERCLEWCRDEADGERFADQKYLDDWPERFSNVVVCEHPGAGLAPWNWMRYRIEGRGGEVRIDGQPLIFYHFHQLKQLSSWICDPGLSSYGRSPMRLRRLVYAPYLRELKATLDWARRIEPRVDPGYTRFGSAREPAMRLLRTVTASALRGQLMFTPGRMVL